jgi:aerobic carbon-monoxide dehydrogenase medium subunit
MIPAEVDYVRPQTLDDALAALAGPEAKALAGGQSLVSALKLRLARPRLLVDIAGIGLRGLELAGGELRIGALIVWNELVDAPELTRPALAGIAECAAGIGDLQVRNRGTVGGSLAHADPASDLPALLLALDATLTLRSSGGTRTVAASDFFLGPFLTALEPHELLTEIVLPEPPVGSGSAYESIEHPASGFALAGAAALVLPDDTRSLAVTGVGGRPFLIGSPDDPEASLAEAEIFGDHFASADYRRHLAAVAARRALARAERRAEEDRTWTA